MRFASRLVLVVLIVLLSDVSIAIATAGEATPLDLPVPSDTSGASQGGSMARTFVGLLVVLAVIYGLAWFIRRTKGLGGVTSESADGAMRVTSSIVLAPGRTLQLVEVRGQLMLIGVTDTGISLLHSYEHDLPQAQSEPVPVIPSPVEPSTAPFARILDDLRARTVR